MNSSLSSEINQRRIRCFYAVYSTGSACAAADSLSTSAAVVTRHIQLLEKELGTLLFERRHRNGMKPTEAAKIVLEYYRASRAQQDHMEVCLDELRSMKRGTIRFALPAAYIDTLMEDMFTDFCHEHPNLNIVVEEINNSSQIVTSVLEDSADVGIIFNNIPNPDILCYTNRLLPMRALVSRSHPLAHEQKVSFEELSRYPLALPPNSFNFRKLLQSAERLEKIQLKTILTTNSCCAQKKFASVKNGATIMTAFAARQEIREGQLIALEIDNPLLTSVEASLVVRRGKIFSPALKKLLGLLKNKLLIFTHNEQDFLPSACTYG
ncbi:LysR family transcriptional regulator [Mycoavidus sp. SF9855]|uniref:LysR family transcriptional regulator n=1 Tax=Mycoavidus sp. SF9855 TaxID=2968475 RepID=UPI00211BD1EB|nr:LysR family transcriptional regulator [Mycoavidus sp. SF9855]UUM21516.1 LysR family transcriptional regulator [Mycoavidus sp. SF9855]